jgi:hypothetical protein
MLKGFIPAFRGRKEAFRVQNQLGEKEEASAAAQPEVAFYRSHPFLSISAGYIDWAFPIR